MKLALTIFGLLVCVLMGYMIWNGKYTRFKIHFFIIIPKKINNGSYIMAGKLSRNIFKGLDGVNLSTRNFYVTPLPYEIWYYDEFNSTDDVLKKCHELYETYLIPPEKKK